MNSDKKSREEYEYIFSETDYLNMMQMSSGGPMASTQV